MYALTEVLERLRRRGLTAKPTKCEIGHIELDLLGHVKILETGKPENQKELRSFLGTIGY